MKRFRVVRHKENAFATYGTLFTEAGEAIGVTIERPFVDKDNDGRRDPNVCRVQHGTFRVIVRVSPKRGYEVPWLCGVPDATPAHFADEPTATTCQMHRANFPWELEGCLGVGTAFGDVIYRGDTVTEGTHPRKHGTAYPGVTASKDAFEKFMALLGGDREFELEIVDNFGAPAGAWA